VVTDTWVSMGQEGESAERLDAFTAYQVNGALMAKAAPGAVFLHSLPAHRGQEVTDAVIDSPASLVWPRRNRLAAARECCAGVQGKACDHARGRWRMRLTKAQRQHRIAQLLERQPVTSQAQLVELLGAADVEATQATVSRDLEEWAR